jgi:AcrR family transcriptional regulator
MRVPQRRQSLIEEPPEDGARPARRAADPSSDRIAATRGRLLDSAEALFLEQGYDDVSVRMINAKAGLNPGAVHYHFGSKRGLVVALLEDRLLRDWESGGGRRFEALEAQPTVSVREVVELSVDPLLALAATVRPGRLYVSLLARVVLGRWDVTWTREAFLVDRWMPLVVRSAPTVPPDVLRVRWELAIALTLELIGRPLDDDLWSPVAVDRDQLVQFLAAGLTAPVAGD